MKVLDRLFLAQEAFKIHQCAEKNLKQLGDKCSTPETVQDYYLGILRRQSILNLDLSIILKSSPADNLTTPMILCRCLMDDFLHMLYLSEKTNADEEIIKINAEAYNEEFKSLEVLTKSNHKDFEGKYAHYMTGEDLKQLKETFSSKIEHKKYFTDVKAFVFKKFVSNEFLAKSIINAELNKLASRAFFLWKHFSSFTHYTNITLEKEMSSQHREIYYHEIEESLLYSYNTMKMAFRFFEIRDNLIFNDCGLEDRYGIKK